MSYKSGCFFGRKKVGITPFIPRLTPIFLPGKGTTSGTTTPVGETLRSFKQKLGRNISWAGKASDGEGAIKQKTRLIKGGFFHAVGFG